MVTRTGPRMTISTQIVLQCNALTDADPQIDGVSPLRRDPRCVLHPHHDLRRHNPEAQAPAQSYFECTRCGAIRDIPDRPPAGYLAM